MNIDMKDEFAKLLEITNDPKVGLTTELRKFLHTELQFGMSRYACRHGTLSDGHEKITDAQRYFGAIREVWSRCESLEDLKADAMDAQAEILEAEIEHRMADSKPKEMRAEARLMRARNRLRRALVNAEDTMRQLDEFNKVRLELRDRVRAQYPGGIEQAEEDNWIAVAKYRHRLERETGVPQMLRHVPLRKEVKAALGAKLDNGELMNWFGVSEEEAVAALIGKDDVKFAIEKLIVMNEKSLPKPSKE